jgi:hypothetical protein
MNAKTPYVGAKSEDVYTDDAKMTHLAPDTVK